MVHKYAGNTTGGNGSEIVDLNSGLWVSNTMNALISKWNSESGVKSNTELESPSSWLAVPPSGMSSTPNCRLFHNLMKILQISADICGHYTVTDERLSAQWKCIGLHSKLQGKLFGDGSDACVQSMDVMVNTVGEPGGRHSLIRTSLRRKYLSSPTPSSSNSSSSRCKETAPQSKTSSEHPARLWAPYCETWSSISPVNRLYIHIGIPLLRLGLQKHQQLNGNCLGSGAIGSSASKEKPQLHGHFRTLVYYASKFLTGLYVCQSENRLQAATAADVALAHTGGKGKNRTTATAVLEDSESAADGNGGDGGDHSGLKLKMKSKTISNAAASGSFPIDPFGLMMQAQTVLQALYVVLMQTNREMNAKVPNAKMGTGSGTSVWCPCLRVVNPDGLVSPCETQKAIVWNVILGLISGICQYKPSSFHQYWNLVYMRDGSLIDSKLTKYVDFLISTKVCSKGGNKDYFVGKPQFVSVFYANAAPLPSQFQSGDMAGIQESAILCLISTVKGNRDLKNLLHKALLSVDTLHWTPLVEQVC